MLGRILCFFGLHSWEARIVEHDNDIMVAQMRCTRCGLTNEIIDRPEGYEPIDDLGVEASDEDRI
jgi:hypothetical protein